MERVTWRHVQYRREREFYTKLRPLLEDLRRKYEAFSDRSQQHEKEFFKYLSHSLKIDQLPRMSRVIRDLNDRLSTNLRISLFLHQSPICNAMCIPRYDPGRRRNTPEELVVLVSQHFLNELTPTEQICILGHELGHLLYEHVHIPAKALLESKFALKDVGALKSHVLKWLTCAEISCDMIGYLAGACDAQGFCQAMLKYTTGLSTAGFESDHECQELVKLLLRQCDDISESVLDSALTTHPLTPLRLKIIQAVAQSALLQNYGRELPESTITVFRGEFNDRIDCEFRKIHPDVIPKPKTESNDSLFLLGVAVAISDGRITQEEIAAINDICETHTDVRIWFQRIKDRLRSVSLAIIQKELIAQACADLKNRKVRKFDIIQMIRKLLIVAKSDGTIERVELDTIYEFSKEFGISKQEIVLLIEQMGIS